MSDSEFITREALLKKRSRRTRTVKVADDHPDPDLAGKKVVVSSMNARERAAWEMQFTDRRTMKAIPARQAEIRERLVIATVIDQQGNPLLTMDDLDALKEVDAALLEIIIKTSQELNDISEDDLASLEKK